MFKHARLALATVLVVTASTAAFAQGNGPKGIPNSQKYSNKGAKPSTGRSGSASLETRVLIAKAGNMLIEASTGSVASGTGPGTITKAQVKIGGFTQNFNGLSAGGFFATTLPASARGTAVQVQTNVKGIDPKRTDVVTVSTPALLRPDIAVSAINGPAQAAPNAPVTFIATVQETNGDVGANADCSLSVDNTVVGTASAIWVDGAGTVSCQFTHTFAAPGTYAVKASANNVVPGDWDTGNNSASTSITILDPSKKFTQGYLSAYQQNSTQYYYDAADGSGYYCGYYYYYYCNYRYERTYNYNYSIIDMQGSMQQSMGQVQRLDVSTFANGNLQHQASLAPVYSSFYDYGNSQQTCSQYYGEYWDGSRWVYSRDYFDTCSYKYVDNPQSDYSYFYYHQRAGDVVYYGSDSYCEYWGCNSYSWINSYSYGGVQDLGWNAGTQVRVKVDFVGTDGQSNTADQTVTLADESFNVNWQNSGSWWDYYYGYRTYNHWSTGTYFRGYTNWYIQP